MHHPAIRPWLYFFIIFFSFTTVAQACLGVSRTINVRSFNAHMGTGPSGGIGLRHKEVVLTFDDGPLAGKTSRILAALSAQCTKATFFVVGRMARFNPRMLQKIARSGHTIAQHTQDHANLTQLSVASAQRNVDAGVASVRKALGGYSSHSTRLFRYPYLARSSALDAMLKRRGLLPFSASIMSQDWKPGSGAGMVNRVMNRLNRQGRGVILLHDIQSKTASALPQLLKRLKAGGYKVVHIRSGRGPRGSSVKIARNKKPSSSRALPGLFAGLASRKDIDRTTTGSVKRKATKRTKVTVSKKKARKSTAKTKAKQNTTPPKSLLAFLKSKSTDEDKEAGSNKRPGKSAAKTKRKRMAAKSRAKAKAANVKKRKSQKTRTAKKRKTADDETPKTLFALLNRKSADEKGKAKKKKASKRKAAKKSVKRSRVTKRKKSKAKRQVVRTKSATGSAPKTLAAFLRPTAKRKGESDKAYKARMKKLKLKRAKARKKSR